MQEQSRVSKASTVVAPLLLPRLSDNRPFISILVKDNAFPALFDSGANISVCSEDTVLRFQKLVHCLNIFPSPTYTVSTADGTPLCISRIVEVPVSIENKTKKVKFHVVPSIKPSIILGMNFAEIFRISVCFKTNSFEVSPQVSLLNQQQVCAINGLSDISNQPKELVDKYQQVVKKFSSLAHTDFLSETNVITHHIETGDAKPHRQRQYPLSPALLEHLNAEIDKLLKLKVIEKSNSPWCSPVLLVKKKDGSYRMCFDGRKLNGVTTHDSYPLPRIDTILSKLRDCNYISSVDLKQAFFQVGLTPESRPKTAFIVPGRGLFQFRRMPFGLRNSAQTQQRLMDLVIGPDLEPYVFVYLDDVIIATDTFSKHIEVLDEVFKRLKKANLTINYDKCQFVRSSLSFLGFTIDSKGLRTDDSKVKTILESPIPKNTTGVRRILGVLQYYRRFIKDFSSISAPITALLHNRKKGQPITWTPEADRAFKTLKERLTTAPVLSSPNFTKPFFIQTDASDYGLGAVLFQEEDGFEHPIAYASRTLSKAEKKYTVTEKECLGVLFGIEYFRPYVEGTRFTVLTDHASLVWLRNIKEPASRLARWCVRLSQFEFDIKYRKGSSNVPADYASRSFSLLTATELIPDDWYNDMIQKKTDDPSQYPDFQLKNGILYKHTKPNHNVLSNTSDWKMVVPTPNREKIISEFHDPPTSGHFGVSKTLSRISELYYWPNMRWSVKNYVKNCLVCGAQKAPNTARAGLMGGYRNINFPFQMISIDFMGPFPRSKSRNTQLLVVTDWFTKFVIVKPLPQATAASVVKFLENSVFLTFGVPQLVLCDNAQVFKSHIFTKLLSDYKITTWYSARHLSQVNPTERTNRTILTAMSSYIEDNHRDWDKNIYKIAQAINLSKNETTQHTPAFLLFARNIPIDGTFYGPVAENSVLSPDKENYIHREKDIQNLPPIFTEIRKRLKKAHETNSKYYNLRKRPDTFAVNDVVWKRTYYLSDASKSFAAKLAPKFVLCRITKAVSRLVYELEDQAGNRLGKWHIKDLKPYTGDPPPEFQ